MSWRAVPETMPANRRAASGPTANGASTQLQETGNNQQPVDFQLAATNGTRTSTTIALAPSRARSGSLCRAQTSAIQTSARGNALSLIVTAAAASTARTPEFR